MRLVLAEKNAFAFGFSKVTISPELADTVSMDFIRSPSSPKQEPAEAGRVATPGDCKSPALACHKSNANYFMCLQN